MSRHKTNKPNPIFTIPDNQPVMFDIANLAYELYKDAWLHTQTTLDQRAIARITYQGYAQNCMAQGFEPDDYDTWLLEHGITGKKFVGFEEFCDEEYHDKTYVKYLLQNDETLLKLYYLDIGYNEDP